MRILLTMAVATILTGAVACERGSKPNPKPQKTHVVTAGAVVEMCVDPAFWIRVKDGVCEAGQDGYRWIYVPYRSSFGKELPAVDRQLKAGAGDWVKPKGVVLVRIPDEGAFFP